MRGVLVGEQLEPLSDELNSLLAEEGIRLKGFSQAEGDLAWLSSQRPDVLLLESDYLKSALGQLLVSLLGEDSRFPHQQRQRRRQLAGLLDEWLRLLRAQPNLQQLKVILYGDPLMDAQTQLRCSYEGLEQIFPLPQQAGTVASQLRAYLRLRDEVQQSQETIDQLSQMNQELYERSLMVEKELMATRQLQQSLLPPAIQRKNR
jgi:hypothetical protein